VRKLIDRRVLQITALRDQMCAGTADGHVVWLADDGHVTRDVDLAAGIAVQDTAAELAVLRDAKLVDSPGLRPHEFPDTVNLEYEFPRTFSDPLAMRGDDVQPVLFAVHVPAAGEYRFNIPLLNGPAEADKLGTFLISADDGSSGQTKPTGADKLHQSAVVALKPGTWLMSIHPRDWKTAPLVREMKIESAK
jgi:hypothetical protein